MTAASGAYDAWQIERGVTCVVAPCCAFTFDKGHTDVADGGYSCPACEAIDLRKRLAAVLAQCDAGEWNATRWEDPLPVPPWVERVRRAALGKPDERAS